MKRLVIMALMMLTGCFFPENSPAEVLKIGGTAREDFQILLSDYGSIAYDPACIKAWYLATTDQNKKKLGSEEGESIKPEWQIPVPNMTGYQFPMLPGVYKFNVSGECRNFSIATNVGNNYVLLEHQGDLFLDTVAVNMMMAKGFTAEKLVPKKKGEKYYYVLIFFHKQGTLSEVPKDRITVGHIVPNSQGFLYRFVKSGEDYPIEPFYPFVRVYRQMK